MLHTIFYPNPKILVINGMTSTRGKKPEKKSVGQKHNGKQMILSAQNIPRDIVDPFIDAKTIHTQTGMSYGLSCAGYDIRIKQDMWIMPKGFRLASTVERFDMPDDVLGIVHDKSTLARVGLSVQNTVIEPGWNGFLTLEISNNTFRPVRLHAGQPIAQVVFHRLDQPTNAPYTGKYQNQEDAPVRGKKEKHG